MENEFRSCLDEAIIRMVGKVSLNFQDIFMNDLSKQIKLKEILEESLYGYNIISECKELLVSDIEEKISLYLNCRILENISEGTIYNYKLILHRFADYFNKPINTITTMDVRFFILQCKKNGDKESTINSKIFALRKFFSWLLDNEIISKDPMKQIKIMKQSKLKPKVMSTEQEELLRENCTTIRERAIIELALSSGLRVSEVANLKLSNLNFNTREITLVGKGKKERTTFFSIKSKMLLEQYLKSRKEFKEVESVFLSVKFPHQQLKSRALQVILNKIKTRAGLENVEFITFHNLRKKCFTDGLSRGLSIAQVQSMAGHSEPSTTINSYISLSNESLRRDYNKAML